MRLLNTATLEFKEFLGSDMPEYAILSHVWSGDEVSYEDYISGRKQDGYGYQKIVKLCELARDGPDDVHQGRTLDWAWIDTCCIDKRSSVELSEAINSMYNWYERSAVCLVFLPDVDELSELETNNTQQLEDWYSANNWQPRCERNTVAAHLKSGIDHAFHVRSSHYAPFAAKAFIGSRWFTRGWTLQEMLAPQSILFYNTGLKLIGNCHKKEQVCRLHRRDVEIGDYNFLSLQMLAAEASGVSLKVIWNGLTIRMKPCTAQRMSWASRRITTRGEDVAYCLLGIFDVNMPLLYGEGASRAFERLQLAILGRSVDQSLFMWLKDAEENRTRAYHQTLKAQSILAPRPDCFHACANAILEDLFDMRSHLLPISPITFTQRGLEMEITLPRGMRPKHHEPFCVIYPLRCKASPASRSFYLVLCIEAEAESMYADGAKLTGMIRTAQRDPFYRNYSHKDEVKILRYCLSANVLTLPKQLEQNDMQLTPAYIKDIVRSWFYLIRPKFVIKLYFPIDQVLNN